MSQGVVIKSNKYGINLILDKQIPFPELLQLIGDKFKQTSNFFRDSKMAISFIGRELTTQEELDIVDRIMQNCSLQIISILDQDGVQEERMRKKLEDFFQKEQKEQEERQEEQKETEEYPEIIYNQDMEIPQAGGYFYKGNLRSGQVLECPSSVTLIGDVNPGARIESRGSIVILGSLRGNACAGSEGDSDSFIFALDMRPLQLQIGDFIAKSPDKEKESKWLKRKEKGKSNQYMPQIAIAREGNICIEPMTKGCLDDKVSQ